MIIRGDTVSYLTVYIDGKEVKCDMVRVLLEEEGQKHDIRAGTSKAGGLWLSQEITGANGQMIFSHERGVETACEDEDLLG